MHSSVHVVYVSDVVQGGVIDSSQLVSPAQWQTSQRTTCLPKHASSSSAGCTGQTILCKKVVLNIPKAACLALVSDSSAI